MSRILRVLTEPFREAYDNFKYNTGSKETCPKCGSMEPLVFHPPKRWGAW